VPNAIVIFICLWWIIRFHGRN